MKKIHGVIFAVSGVVLVLVSRGLSDLSEIHAWELGGLDEFLTLFGVAAVGIGLGIVMTLDINGPGK